MSADGSHPPQRAAPAKPANIVAAELAMRGFRVFPLVSAGDRPKRPLKQGWQESASSGFDEILSTWPVGRYPGILTNGLVVLDADVSKGGLEALARLGSLPPTLTVRTMSGGLHVYFRTPAGTKFQTRACTIRGDGIQVPAIPDFWGIDVRAEGGLVVGPGAVFDGKGYAIEADLPIAELPAFLAELLRAAPVKVANASAALVEPDTPAAIDLAKAYLERDAPRNVSVGSRGATAYQVAAKLGDFGVSCETALELMVPWNDAHGGGQTLEALTEAVEHSFEYRQDPIGREHPTRPFALISSPPGETSRPLLDPKDPMPSARQLVARQFTSAEHRTLHRTNGDFLQWTGTHYRRALDDDIRSVIWKFLDATDRIAADKEHKPKRVPFQPNTTRAGDVFNALAAVTNVDARIVPPAWLPGVEAAKPLAIEMLPCANGLLHVPSRRLHPLTPAFLGLNALPYAYDADAGEPTEWLKFLRSVWGEDPETANVLQEWFGYVLTVDTRYQKILLIVGPKRSGKGTIGRVLTAMLGQENVAGPTLNSLAGPFGLEPLIDKQLAIVSDARLGNRADQSAITERLLAISGEDHLSVDRKHRTAWTGRLGARFMLLTNELPRLADASGALPSRLIVLQCRRSFFGREDHGLEQRLTVELPAILNWSLAGLARLSARGRFVQPEAAADAIREIEDLASPISAFIRECCETGPTRQIECAALFHRWSTWCRANGRDHPGASATFSRDLQAAVAHVSTVQPRMPDGTRPRHYQGIGLKSGAF